jgi:hypothetical protein
MRLPRLRAVATLSALTLLGGVVYGGAIALLFGRGWLAAFGRRDGVAKPELEEPIG